MADIPELDDEKIEFLVGLVYTVTAAASIGAGEVSMFGIDLMQQVQTINDGMFVIDLATIGSGLALIYVWFTNRPTIGNMELIYQIVIGGSVLLLFWGSYDPGFAADMDFSVQIGLIGLSLAGYWGLAHDDG